jgi:hypothetical protein
MRPRSLTSSSAILHVRLGLGQQRVVGQAHQRPRLEVGLVLDLPHQLLEHVLQRHHALQGAQAVHHHREVLLAGLELPQQIVGAHARGHEPGLGGQGCHGLIVAPVGQRLEDPAHVHHPHHAVEVVGLVQGDAGVGDVPGPGAQVPDGSAGLEGIHLGHGGHDHARGHVVHPEDALDQLALVLLDHAFPAALAGQGADLGLGGPADGGGGDGAHQQLHQRDDGQQRAAQPGDGARDPQGHGQSVPLAQGLGDDLAEEDHHEGEQGREGAQPRRAQLASGQATDQDGAADVGDVVPDHDGHDRPGEVLLEPPQGEGASPSLLHSGEHLGVAHGEQRRFGPRGEGRSDQDGEDGEQQCEHRDGAGDGFNLLTVSAWSSSALTMRCPAR